MEIKPMGILIPSWDEEPHCAYDCTITTPRGNMSVRFYDSIHNTEILIMSEEQYYEKKYNRCYDGRNIQEKKCWQKRYKEMRTKAIPTEYDVLACLTKYDVGTMDDFICEFGYEIKCTKDITNFINTYNAVVKEYNDIRRCFTEEQIEALCEIN